GPLARLAGAPRVAANTQGPSSRAVIATRPAVRIIHDSASPITTPLARTASAGSAWRNTARPAGGGAGGAAGAGAGAAGASGATGWSDTANSGAAAGSVGVRVTEGPGVSRRAAAPRAGRRPGTRAGAGLPGRRGGRGGV